MKIRIPALAAACLALGLYGCTSIETAFNVATHEVSADPVKVSSGTYKLDPEHWSLLFDVDHFGFSRFVSRFDRMEATLDVDAAAPEKSRVHVIVKAGSINTNVPVLDKSLAGAEMFDAARYPDIVFESTSLTRTGASTGKLTGRLTLRKQPHPVTLNVVFRGGAANPMTGKETLGFSAEGVLDRSQWGLSAWWPAVGNDVHIAIQAEFIKTDL